VTTLLQSLTTAAIGFAALTVASAPARTAEAVTADAVVELFTSQGCSSCPPADRVAGELIRDSSKLLVLSLPVDYWDYLGWKDTFSQHAFTERQRTYARARGDGQVYTPQVVVNGLQHVVGSERGSIEDAIAQTSATLKGKQVALKLTPDADGLTVEIGAAPAGIDTSNAKVMLADFKSSADVKIGRGENGGSHVTYYHVVRELKSLGDWSGKAQTLHIAKADLTAGGSDGCAVILQSSDGGPILAGAQVASW
jgi:hypothetical protein